MRETSAARLARLLALVPWLTQHPGVSITEAAKHFGVTPQVLERDLWLVVCCGLPGHGPDQLIDIQFWEDDGIIDVIDPQTLQRPLRLTSEEAMALLVGLRLLANVPAAGDQGTLASVTGRLEEALADRIAPPDATVVLDPVDAEIRDAVATALREGRALSLRYAGATRDTITERTVEPLTLREYAGHEYLTAYCQRAGAQRTFRLDRIVQAELGEPMTPRAAAEAPMPVVPMEGTVVRLRVEPSARWFVETADLMSSQSESDGSTVVELVVADVPWLIRTVVGLGGRLEIVSPVDLREEVRRQAERLLEEIPGDLPSA